MKQNGDDFKLTVSTCKYIINIQHYHKRDLEIHKLGHYKYFSNFTSLAEILCSKFRLSTYYNLIDVLGSPASINSDFICIKDVYLFYHHRAKIILTKLLCQTTLVYVRFLCSFNLRRAGFSQNQIPWQVWYCNLHAWVTSMHKLTHFLHLELLLAIHLSTCHTYEACHFTKKKDFFSHLWIRWSIFVFSMNQILVFDKLDFDSFYVWHYYDFAQYLFSYLRVSIFSTKSSFDNEYFTNGHIYMCQ